MSHLKRIVTEQVMQFLAISVSLVDRLLLVGLLYRFWGSSTFEAWSVALAFAGLVSLFELGFNMYFSNRLMIETENGQLHNAQRTLRLANLIFGLCAALSILATVGLLLLVGLPTVSTELAGGVAVTIVLLSLATALRLSLAGVYGLYRANRQFGRFVMIGMSSDLGRIIVVAVVVVMGAGIIWAAAATLWVTAAVQGVFVFYDVQHRFGLSAFRWQVPDLDDLREILPPSGAYFMQMIPLILLTNMPVLFLNWQSTATGLVATFVLLRTLAGTPRALLQSLGVVMGQECARRLAVGDHDGAFSVLNMSARVFSILSGLAAGVLFAAGSQIVTAWTGDPHLYRSDYLAVALLPMLICSASVMMHNLLSANNTPYLAAAGRGLQLALTVAIVAAVPIGDPGLRMFAALTSGEVLGFAPLAYVAAAGLLWQAGIVFHLRQIGFSLLAAALAAMATLGAVNLVAPRGLIGLILVLLLALPFCGAFFYLFGLPVAFRQQVIARWVGPRDLRDGSNPMSPRELR